MVSDRASNSTVRGVTLLVWALAAGSAVYWGLKLSSSSSTVPRAAVVAQQTPPADPVAVARLLGHTATSTPVSSGPAPAAASRFSLVGVVADRAQQGAALIAVDGRPPKPFRVGSAVDDGLVLKSVQPRRAVLASSVEGPAVVTLELPAPATAPR